VSDGETVQASPQIGLQFQGNRIQGVIPPQVTLPTDASPQPYVVVSPNEGLVEAMHRMNLAEVDYALVSDSAEPDSVESIIGILSADDIARASRKTADLLR
jgi:CIC family chloride channel protein